MNDETLIPDAIRAALRESGAATGLDLFNAPLVVAVSGGPDSLALLHALRAVVPSANLIVAHLDHALRSSSADEALLVRTIAAAWELRYEGGRVDVARFAAEEGLSLEEAGRVARYRFLAKTARVHGAPAILTGHNADDQVESVLMHLLRGSGLGGLRGMAAASPLPENPALWLFRPLLRVPRETIEAYCHVHNLQPSRDASNDDPTFFRNRLRHELLPLLGQASPRVRERLTTLAEVVAGDDDLLRKLEGTAYGAVRVDEGAGWIVLDRELWRAQSLALRRRLLRRALFRCLPGLRDAGFRSLEAARLLAENGSAGERAALPGGATLSVGYGRLNVVAPGAVLPLDAPQLADDAALLLPVPGEVVLLDGWSITAERVDVDLNTIARNADPFAAYISPRFAAGLLVRGRLSGERFQPHGLQGRYTKIKEWMIDHHLPAVLRLRWPIVGSPDHALWIASRVLDYRARVLPGEDQAILLRCTRRPESHPQTSQMARF